VTNMKCLPTMAGYERLVFQHMRGPTRMDFYEGLGSFSIHVWFKWWTRLIPLYRFFARRKILKLVQPNIALGTVFHGVVCHRWRYRHG